MSGGFSNPERILKDLNITQESRVADFGSGSGYFTLLLAKTVGPNGLVTAVDVLESALGVIKSKAQDQGLYNVSYVRSNLEQTRGSGLGDNTQDIVLLANILFQSQKKETIVTEAIRVLRPGGKLVMIDWVPHAIFGPREEGWKFSKEEGQKLGTSAGLTLEREIAVSVNHWGLLFEK